MIKPIMGAGDTEWISKHVEELEILTVEQSKRIAALEAAEGDAAIGRRCAAVGIKNVEGLELIVAHLEDISANNPQAGWRNWANSMLLAMRGEEECYQQWRKTEAALRK